MTAARVQVAGLVAGHGEAMNITKCVCPLASLTLALAVVASAQKNQANLYGGLPRHGVAGLAVAAADPAQPENPATNPPTVTVVAAGSAGEAAGIERGDILKEVDGEPATGSSQFAYQVRKHLAGDSVRVVVLRAGVKLERTVILR